MFIIFVDGLEQTISQVGGLAHLISVIKSYASDNDKTGNNLLSSLLMFTGLLKDGLRALAALACDSNYFLM